MKPGAIQVADGMISINEGRATKEITVKNTGTRSIQVGSHFHFAEANRALAFDRAAALGMRLDIPSGTSIRLEPGEEKTVSLVELGGRRTVRGLNGMSETLLDERGKEKALNQLKEAGWIEGVKR
ncbi:urease subunit beta [Bacillus glycinifermentans]|uniref:Urease subunit beta n=1 Tax=Bacillus glycinifermentans TaxID=1664069 RepID=A0A0T6BKD9_9BACI|nr:urease subunit beta [Bacillus glycinifermentans]ATH93511.1 urease subunit beta [Bacillus glycinifermentans]KRT90323.1 urease subunit beta [Bacillus glycinifermentans]MEC0484018.1 urease subunit beta [Bacillus glycinifermentans]MEC0492863.1 urease subunit beta [Bacillus glycinifermentans]MEC0539945.1 urease subunit beta [Bacillus glycinifermentans]